MVVAIKFFSLKQALNEPMMRMFLVAMSLVAIVMMGCGPSATTSESDSGASPQQPGESAPALLLDEESAISILQHFLQECVQSWDKRWDGPYRTSPYNEKNPLAEQEMKRLRSLLIDLATGENGDLEWSASYHGVTDVSNTTNLVTGMSTEAETWVVIGPGLERAGSQLVVPGRWRVYAGIKDVYYLDAPARLALQEYNRFWTCYR